MKNIRTIVLATFITGMTNALQAQVLPTKTTAKPEEPGIAVVTIKLQTAPDTKPDPGITGMTKQQTPAKENTAKQPADKEEPMPKPQAMDSKAVVTTPAMSSEKRSDAKKVQPIMPAQDPNMIPATTAKPVTIPQQQE